MFRAWLQSNILLQINPAQKRSPEHKAHLCPKARKTLMLRPFLFKRERIKKKKTSNPCPGGWKYPETCLESALKALNQLICSHKSLRTFPSSTNKLKHSNSNQKHSLLSPQRHTSWQSHRFPSVSGVFKEKKTLMYVKGSGMTAQAWLLPTSIFPSFLRARDVKMSRQGRNKWLCHGLAWTAIISAAVCDAGGSGWRWVHGAVQQQSQNPGAHCLTQQVLTSEAALTYGYRNLKEEERIFFFHWSTHQSLMHCGFFHILKYVHYLPSETCCTWSLVCTKSVHLPQPKLQILTTPANWTQRTFYDRKGH